MPLDPGEAGRFEIPIYQVFRGAQSENRTRDLRITNALLYRLSYLGAARDDIGDDALRGRGSGVGSAHSATWVPRILVHGMDRHDRDKATRQRSLP